MSAPLNIALDIIRRGWNPTPLAHRGKKPLDREWQRRIIDEAKAPHFFNGKEMNVGVVLGPTSKGLTDIDLDCAEAIELAPYLLPRTNAIFGRPSSPASHWLYTTSLSEIESCAVIPFKDPSGAMIIELRIGGAKGAQTVAPGSTHETGERVEWTNGKAGDPAPFDGLKLLQCVAALASGVLLVRSWPAEGGRHDAARVLGGFLARLGWSPAQVRHFVGSIAMVADDNEREDRERAAEDAAKAHVNGQHAYGFPALSKTFGPAVASSIADWLGFKTNGESTAGDTQSPNKETPQAQIRAQPFVYRDPRSIPPRKWLYDKHFTRGYVSADISPGGVGKTSLLLVEAIAMASGRSLMGAALPKPLTVWYINLEDPLEEIERRIAAILVHYDIKPEEIAGRLYINSGRDTPLIIAEKHGDKTLVMRPVVEAMSREIQERQVDVLLIDPFVNSHGVPESDNGAINMVARTWVRLAEECACAIGLIHHVRKPGAGQAEFTVDDARGASALIGAVRSARVLNIMSKDDAARAGIDERERRFYFRVDDGKANMKPPLDRAVWRKLVSVGLNNGTNDAPEDLVGVVTAWTMPGAFDGLETADLRKVQAAVAAEEWAENPQAVNWVGYAIAEVLDWDADTKAGQQRIKTVLKTWIENKVLRVERRFIKRDGREKPFVVVGDLV